MYPKSHFIASGLAAILLFPFYKWAALLVFIGGFLVDIDHVLFHYLATGELSILNAYKHHMEMGKNLKLYKGPQVFFLFHNVELLLAFGILAFFSSYFLLVFVGLLLHYILDMIFDYSSTKRFVKCYSVILYILSRRTKKNKSLK